MAFIDPESTPSDHLHAENASHPAPTGQESPLEPRGRLLALALAAALAAGVASLFVGEMILRAYQSDLFPPLKVSPSIEEMTRLRAARLYTATLTFTTLGGLLGMTMGLAGGMAGRSVFVSIRAAILGLLLGTAVVASLALVLVSFFFKKFDPQVGDLILPLLTHGSIWSAVGAIGGLAFGLGLGGQGRWKSTLVGGLLGGAVATIIYEIVGALAFASSKTDLPVSSSITTRALAQLLVASLSAAGAVLVLNQSAKQVTSASRHS